MSGSCFLFLVRWGVGGASGRLRPTRGCGENTFPRGEGGPPRQRWWKRNAGGNVDFTAEHRLLP